MGILWRNRNIAWFALFLGFLTAGIAPAHSFQSARFEHAYHSTTMIDSTRKDHYTLGFADSAVDPAPAPASYDRSAVGSIHDLTLSFKGDLTDSQILDISEALHYRKYRPQDYRSASLSLHKYDYLDHLLSVKYGLTIGDSDAFQLEYRNNIFRAPEDLLGDYTANTGHIRFSHKIRRHSALSFSGRYEVRNYAGFDSADYEESLFAMEFSRFFAEKLHYRPVSTTSRGSLDTFSNYPNGLAARKAVDYYTDWAPNPADPEAGAKYLARVARGDIHVSLTGDVSRRRYTAIDHEYQQPRGVFRATYDPTRSVRLVLEDVYYQRRHDTESQFYLLHDHRSNRASLAGTYRPNRHWAHIITAANELFVYDQQTDRDFVLNTISWETFFHNSPHTVSLFLQDALTRQGQSRLYHPDSDRIQAVVAYAYALTESWTFDLKDEWIDHDIKRWEDVYTPSYVQNTWNAGFSAILDRRNSLELGYQNSRKTGRVYTHTNVTEKTLYLSWNATL